jgi:hypothetical protein
MKRILMTAAAACALTPGLAACASTVGFQITEGGNAATMLQSCASTPANFFLPASGGDLSEAFAAIGRDITQLRISK